MRLGVRRAWRDGRSDWGHSMMMRGLEISCGCRAMAWWVRVGMIPVTTLSGNGHQLLTTDGDDAISGVSFIWVTGSVTRRIRHGCFGDPPVSMRTGMWWRVTTGIARVILGRVVHTFGCNRRHRPMRSGGMSNQALVGPSRRLTMRRRGRPYVRNGGGRRPMLIRGSRP